MTEYLSTLKRIWGYDSFRGIQKDVIESIGSGKDTLGLMPTGGGKSICFQVPALTMDGVCIVVTPLVALMKDQVSRLRELGIKAAAVHSSMRHDQILTALENCILGNYEFLYVSPERLESELFLTKLRHMRVSFVCVDEAHCISQWGYDFRPSYLRLQQLRKMLPGRPFLALTATATAEVVRDIQHKLAFTHGNVFKMSFARPNLYYCVQDNNDKLNALTNLLNRHKGTTIIYTNSRDRAEEYSRLLQESGYSATFFHAGLSETEKDLRQQKWRDNQTRIMVATNAFGMGIDKPDVRLVVHLNPPDSLEAYYQETGRAGRDGELSYAIMLASKRDIAALERRTSTAFPPKEEIREVYDHICYYLQIGVGSGLGITREFNTWEFCRLFKHNTAQATSAMVILELCGYISLTDEEDTVSRMQILATRSQLYGCIHGDTEILFNYLLRTYSGIFREFAYIDETEISRCTGMELHEIYERLLSLSRVNIIRYIPRKKVAFIKFTHERVEGRDLHITSEAYEHRRDRYERRVHSMLDYLNEHNECRTKFLLRYFDERLNASCGNCDNCLASAEEDNCNYDTIRASIIKQLKDKPKMGYELDMSDFSQDEVMVTVRTMTEEGELQQEGLMLKLALKKQ